MTKLPLIVRALFGAALLSACSSAMPADIRHEVAGPLFDARLRASHGDGRAAIMAKLNQAASVPNLNKDEVHEIRITGEHIFARAADPYGAIAPPLFSETSPPSTSSGVGYTGLH